MVFLFKGSCLTSSTGEKTVCFLITGRGRLAYIMLLRRVSITENNSAEQLPSQFPDITAQLATLTERNKGEIRYKLEVDNRNNAVLPSANIHLFYTAKNS